MVYDSEEIPFMFADNFCLLATWMTEFKQLRYGEATRAKLNGIWIDGEKCRMLRLQLSPMLDLRSLVSATTYDLDGDRLELLLVYNSIEGRRARFRASMRSCEDAV